MDVHDVRHTELAEHHAGRPGEVMVSVTHELRPGLSAAEVHAGLYVDADVALRAADGPWGGWTDVPGEREADPDAPVTRGAFGPFPCPVGTVEIAVRLSSVQVTTIVGGEVRNADAPDLLTGRSAAGGTATIDLRRHSGRWAPEADGA